MTHSRGNGKTIKEYWYDENTEPQEYYPYNVDLLINLNGKYLRILIVQGLILVGCHIQATQT